MAGTVSVVIPTRNRSAMLIRLIKQLVPQLGSDLVEIIVVDNASSDDTQELVSTISQVTYIRNETNHLSARARQQGWDIATGEYVCFIDDDNIVEPSTLSSLAEFMDKHTEFGLASPIQRRWSDSHIWCAGGRINRFLMVSYDKHFDTSQEVVEVDFQPNVFMVRSSLRGKNVYFDWQRFPHNWSEASFGNLIRSAGFKVGTCLQATVYHDIDYSGYFTRINPTNIFDQAQSRIMFRKAYYNNLETWLLFVLVYLPISTVALILTTRKRDDKRKLMGLYLKGTICGFISPLHGT